MTCIVMPRKGLKNSIIDIQRKVFNSQPDPLSLFPFIFNTYYSAEGHHLVAETIKKRLEADNYIPIKSRK